MNKGYLVMVMGRFKNSIIMVLFGSVMWVGLIGCSDDSLSLSGLSNNDDSEIVFDETAFSRAKQILEKYPEEALPEESGRDSSETGGSDIDAQGTPDDGDSIGVQAIPEKEASEVMQFVDEVTLEVLDRSEVRPQQKSSVMKRHCEGDGIDSKSQKYHENVQDHCLLPKMQIASQLFNIRYTFARCIFEQENPHRDRLAHNQNGNGLAQIVNVTMREINGRWHRGDSLAATLKQCFQTTSNRHDHYLDTIENLLVPASYSKKDIYNEAAHRPPSVRVNPLYRDDSVCLGLMTMGIKVQEAKGRKKAGSVSDAELARRYNGSKYQQRYARAVVNCIERYKKDQKDQKLVQR